MSLCHKRTSRFWIDTGSHLFKTMNWSSFSDGLVECVQEFLTPKELRTACLVCPGWNVKGTVYSHIKRRHSFDKAERVLALWMSEYGDYIQHPLSLFLDLSDARPPCWETLRKNQLYHPIPFKTFLDECMSTISQDYVVVSLKNTHNNNDNI